MSNPWQQVFESHREQIEQEYIVEKYGQHKSDESEETQALYDLRNKLKNMGKDAVVAYLKRSKMSPERKARLARELGISIAENYDNDIQEMTPPGDKYERMVKHIKSGYKEGGLSKNEKSIAYATAWKAKNKETAKEEFEVLEEESKILVRVTKEDGSIFQKKIPSSQLDDYRKRYKTVVVVGASEQSKTGDTAKNEEYVSEKKTHRWWDDDGDGKGYESGEVSGKFKKKKKKKMKEQYSDWRSEYPELAEATKAQKSVEGKSDSSYETQEGDKKKRKKKCAKSECSCSHEVKEAAEVLADELGGELIEINESPAAGKAVVQALKTLAKNAPKLNIGTEPAGKLAVRTGTTAIVKAKPQTTAIVKAKPQTTAIVKAKSKTTAITKTKPQTKTSTKTANLVKLDSKTGAITATQTKPQLAIPPTKPPTGVGEPPKGPGGGSPGGRRGGGGLICLPWMQKLGLCTIKPYLSDPLETPGTLKL